ncbi:hypothetical protein BBJ28_00022842 [Nothophytophthora sp. Chile5]|nr:hypothetical protein BBJ28_00022842 [Nothophytophthora sp. Chile5]
MTDLGNRIKRATAPSAPVTMVQSFFGDTIGQSGPVVPGLIAAAVVVALYSVSGFSKASAEEETAVKRVRYLPSKIPIVGNAIEFMRNADQIHDWVADQLGPTDGEPMLVSLPGQDDMMFIAKPEHFEQVLKTQFDVFPKSSHMHDVFFDLLGDSIVTTNGDVWKRQRRIFVSLFSARALREHMAPISQKYAKQLVGILKEAAASKQPLDAFGLIHRYTLDVFAEIGFGTETGALEGRYQPFGNALDAAQYIVAARCKEPTALWKIKRWLNVGSERRLRESMRVFNEHVMSIVSSALERKHRRSVEADASKPDRDIVSIILDSLEASNEPVDPVEVRNIAAAALIGGRDTTADSLGWLFHMLSQNPRVEAKLRSEILRHLPKLSTDADYVPSMDEVQDIPYLEATLRELLRLYPAGALIVTHCSQDTVFPDATFIPKDTVVGLSFYATGRLTSVWGPNALMFEPERFLDAETGKVAPVPATKLCAFSAGPRACAGQNLSFMEMRIVTACIFGRFHLAPQPGQKKVAYSQGMTLGMQHPLMMTVESVNAKH